MALQQQAPAPSQAVLHANTMRLCDAWRQKYPVVMQAAATGIVAELMPKLVEKAVVVPIVGAIPVNAELIRTPSAMKMAVRTEVVNQLAPANWTNPELTKNLADSVATAIEREVEAAIKEAEADRNFLQWVFRANVLNNMQLSCVFFETVLHHETFATIEGLARVERCKAGLGGDDSVLLNMNLTLRLLTVDSQKMVDLNKSPGLKAQLETRDALDDLLS